MVIMPIKLLYHLQYCVTLQLCLCILVQVTNIISLYYFLQGVTLSTRLDSTILVDPPAHEARQLKIWYQQMLILVHIQFTLKYFYVLISLIIKNDIRAGQNAVLFAQIIKEKPYTRYNPDLFLQSPQKFTLIFYLQPTQKVIIEKVARKIDAIVII